MQAKLFHHEDLLRVPVSYDLQKLLLKGLSKPPEIVKEVTGHGRGEISWDTPWTP